MRHWTKAAVALTTMMVATPTEVSANSYEDTYGADAKVKAMGGAGTALARGPAAVYYNLAALAFEHRPQAVGSFDVVVRNMKLESGSAEADEAAELDNSYAYAVGLSTPLISSYACPICGKHRHREQEKCPHCGAAQSGVDPWYLRFHLGAWFSQAFAPPTRMLGTTASGPERPRFALLSERLEKMTICAGIAVRVLDSLALAIGASLLADSLTNTDADISALSGESVEVSYDYEMQRAAAVHAGVLFRPIEGLHIGASFRSSLSHQLTAFSTTTVDVLGVQTEYLLKIDTVSWYTPLQAALGASYQAGDWLVAADATWQHWSTYQGPYARVEVLETPGSGLLSGAAAPDPEFQDTITPRLGGQFRPIDWLSVQAGYAFVMTPAPEATDVYDVLDSSRHVVSVGAGVTLGEGKPAERAFRAQLAFQMHFLQDREATRTSPEAELKELSYGGMLLSPSLTLAYRF